MIYPILKIIILKYIFEIEIKLMEETLQNDEFISIHRNQINP